MHCHDTGCVAKINDSTLLYSGGSGTPTDSYLYDVERDTWTRMSDLSYLRYGHGCGSIDAQVGLKRCTSKYSFCYVLHNIFVSFAHINYHYQFSEYMLASWIGMLQNATNRISTQKLSATMSRSIFRCYSR